MPCLALLILLDQFPRNMFRGHAKAFASDPRALDVAVAALFGVVDAALGARRWMWTSSSPRR